MNKVLSLLGVVFFLLYVNTSAQVSRNIIGLKPKVLKKNTFLAEKELKSENPNGSENKKFEKKCSTNFTSQRIFEEYGSIFSASLTKVLLPNNCYFKNEVEVQRFQKRVTPAAVTIDGVKVELQAEALQSFLAARKEAQKLGFDINPKAADSSRRSFSDTVRLWRGQVSEGLSYWVKNGKINKQESARIKSLPLDKQVLEVLRLEEEKIFFGNGYQKSILHSVAVPGASQHNLMLAIDVEQHSNPKIRAILAKHGWFQTVRNDTSHFSYLGLKESELPSFGLKRALIGGRIFWIVRTQSRSTKNATRTPFEKNNRTSEVKETRFDDEKNGEEKANRKKAALVKRTVLILPASNIPATANKDVILPISLEPLVSALTQRYYLRTNRKLHITSGYRPPERQAKAMYFNLRNYGVAYVADTYGGRAAVWEIIRAYQDNRENEEKAVLLMTKIIRNQIKRGVKISDHLLEKAFDIRSRGKEAAILSILREIVRNMGGRVVVEKDHYHVEF